MTLYRRINSDAPWHWLSNCPHWPVSHFEELSSRSRMVNICEECRELERNHAPAMPEREAPEVTKSLFMLFVCYEDASGAGYASDLKNRIEKQLPFKVFLANTTDHETQSWENLTNEVIDACKYFVAIISDRNTEGAEILRLSKRAIELNKRIIPLTFAGCESMLTAGLMTFRQFYFKDSQELSDKVRLEVKKIDELESKGLKINQDPDEQVKRGILFYTLRQFDSAFKAFAKAAELSPGYAQAWLNTGVTLHTLKHYEEALKNYNRAIELSPGLFQAWGYKGGALYELGRLDESLEAYNRTIELNTTNCLAWLAKGIIFDQQGRYDEALKAYDQALELNPKEMSIWDNKSVILDNLARLRESLKSGDRGLNSNSMEALVWLNKGVALGKLGKLDEALQAFDKVIEIAPDSFQAWSNKALILNTLGKTEQASPILDKIQLLNKKYPERIQANGSAQL